MRKLKYHPFNYPRFQVCPPDLPDESDKIHCPHCGRKALEFIDDKHVYDQKFKPTVYEIYCCRWCRRIFKKVNHDKESYLPELS